MTRPRRPLPAAVAGGFGQAAAAGSDVLRPRPEVHDDRTAEPGLPGLPQPDRSFAHRGPARYCGTPCRQAAHRARRRAAQAAEPGPARPNVSPAAR